MVFDMTYDIVLPMGAGCPTAMSLSHHSMRFLSYPFDWHKVGSIDNSAHLLASRFNDFLHLDDLRICETEEEAHHLIVENTRWGYSSYHDFPKNRELSDSLPDVVKKYQRRISRLTAQLDSGQKVLLLYMDYPLEQNELTSQQLLDALARVQQTYPNSSFSLLYIHNDESRQYSNRLEKQISDHICQVSMAYNAHCAESPWLVHYAALTFLFSRINISTTNKDKSTLKRYIAWRRNIGTSEHNYLKRQRFATNFADLILRKKSVWQIAKVIYELMKH